MAIARGPATLRVLAQAGGSAVSAVTAGSSRLHGVLALSPGIRSLRGIGMVLLMIGRAAVAVGEAARTRVLVRASSCSIRGAVIVVG